MAELENSSVTTSLQTFTLKVSDYGTFHFRINPAIATPEGKLETMVVDIGYGKEEDSDTFTPCQQVVIKGTWEGNNVINTRSELSPVNPTEWKLDESLIAKTVAQSLDLMKRKKIADTKTPNLELQEEPSPVIINAPDKYSTTVN